VDSAVVRIDVYERPPLDVPDEALFFRVVRAGFGQKRKQLRNAISAGMGLDKAAADALLRAAGVDPQRRAETLSLEEWAALARAVAELRAERVGNDEWRYRDDNKFACAVTRLDLITLGAGLLDERGVDYGVWCNYHGHVIEEKSEK